MKVEFEHPISWKESLEEEDKIIYRDCDDRDFIVRDRNGTWMPVYHKVRASTRKIGKRNER